MENPVLANLEPKGVFRFFEELTRIPHGSGNTAAVSAWAADFAKARPAAPSGRYGQRGDLEGRVSRL